MSLEGSLETIALPEVLQLLSDTSKSGELLVSGDRGDGRLWFDGGKLSGFEVQRCSEPSDALFELLRAGSGRFSFDAGVSRPESAHQVGGDEGEDVRPVLEVAQAHLEEWTGIVAVVPSLDHAVSLAPQSPREKLTITSSQWSLVVTIGEGRRVGEVLDRAGLSEFEGCRSLKEMVQAKLVNVSEPEVAAEPEPVVEAEPVGFEVEPASFEAEPASFEVEAVSFEVAEPEAVAVEPEPEVPVPDVHFETGEVAANGAVNGGVFDGHDYVFKAPVQADDAGFEPHPVPYPDTYTNGHGVYDAESDDASVSSRKALEALLAEIPADDTDEFGVSDEFGGPGSEGGAVQDGLADRGPWTSTELASFDETGAWQDDAASGHQGGEYDFSHVDAEDAHAAPAVADYRFEQVGDEAHYVEEHHVEEHAAGEQYDDQHPVTDAYPAAGSDSVDEPEEEEETSQPEPVNRGLLLKFLSSVRS